AHAYTDTAVATGGTATNAYTDNREAAVRSDMADGDAATLSAANAYTDTQIASIVGFDPGSVNGRLDALEDRFADVDSRFNRQDRRIDRMGAMSSAMLNMAINASGSASPRGRIAVGAGFQGGEQALSIGYGKRIGQRASFSLGGAFSGSEKSGGIGFGLDL
ncbi:MAG TPA: YadA C-terminal domain-containing protein, partial [Pseudoxanthomonas sp.]|nr:YadA C-terminal domain-containing protein [Pseudoxanthomonas sp.]